MPIGTWPVRMAGARVKGGAGRGQEGRVSWEKLFGLLDTIAGGRSARLRVPEVGRTSQPVRRAFTIVAGILVVVFFVGAGAVAEAIYQTVSGNTVSGVVWWRLLVIFAIASTLFYFWFRARMGLWWAYSRLRLFSIVFPCVAIGTCFIPGLYPTWMIVEQVAFSTLVLGTFVVLSQRVVRTAYAKPPRP